MAPAHPRSGTLVAMYHYIRDGSRPPRLNALAPADFDTQLDWLADTRRVIGFDAFAELLSSRTSDDGTALLTFDDGLVDHYEVAFPRLSARGWSGSFFLAGQTLGEPPRVLTVHKTHLLIGQIGAPAFAQAVHLRLSESSSRPTSRHAGVYRYEQTAVQADVKHLLNYDLAPETADSIVDDIFQQHFSDEAAVAKQLYLSADQIREMAAGGMTFGFHTERHRLLSRLHSDAQRHEIQRGVAIVRELTGQRHVPFCYPFGHPHTYDAVTRELLAEHGYAAAFNTTRRTADPASDLPFDIPRWDTRDLPPFQQLDEVGRTRPWPGVSRPPDFPEKPSRAD